MVGSASIHFDARMKLDRNRYPTFDSITIQDRSWDSEIAASTGSELILFIEHKYENLKALDELIALLQGVRNQILPNCDTCLGTGTWTQEVNDRWHDEPYFTHEPCPDCQGEGKVYPSESNAA